MNMKIISSEKKICPCCMEEHDVKNVIVKEKAIYKDIPVEYDACYKYCDNVDELYMDEQQIQENDIALKDAYRKKMGLLTSYDISSIREKYGISQGDMCVLLGWGGKTITRYESHQVQDRAHDTILKKIDRDPEWFISLLIEAEDNLSPDAYRRYLSRAKAWFEADRDLYLRKAIAAKYARFSGNELLNGNTDLSLNKVVDVIRYFAASKDVSNLYKVKLMKLLWYADALSYKIRGRAITGLVYQALPMGAVPLAHNSIIELMNVPCEEIDMGETTAYYFHLNEAYNPVALEVQEKEILAIIIQRFGQMSKDEIVSFMHSEKAYTETAPKDFISFEYSKYLNL